MSVSDFMSRSEEERRLLVRNCVSGAQFLFEFMEENKVKMPPEIDEEILELQEIFKQIAEEVEIQADARLYSEMTLAILRLEEIFFVLRKNFAY